MAATPRPRPLLSVRLIGPADIVTAQKAFLLAHYAKAFRDRDAVCRSSTHPARNHGELRVYLTITAAQET